MADETLLSWQTHEFRPYAKNSAWYITFAIIVILIVVFMILQKDIFGAVSIAIIAGFVAAFSRQKPKVVTISLTDKGIKLDNMEVAYKEIRYFWIVDNDNHKTLNLETTAYLNRTLIVELDDQDPETIRGIMSQFAPEHDSNTETIVQKVMHKLKF